MTYNVQRLDGHVVSKDNFYLLDSNIWIKVLAPRNKQTPKDKIYISFFESFIKTKGVKIIVPALVISEVMNRLIREVHMNKFIKNKRIIRPVKNDFYKNVFRPSLEYRIAYAVIADNIKIYLDELKLANDGFGDTVKYKHVLSHFDYNLDFNDNYYYNLSKKRGYTIVTDDKDFWVKGVNVLTQSHTLLSKMEALTSNK